jgi:small subunit ribosomal protein S8
MSMQDPIADMINRINNAKIMNKPTVSMDSSKIKASIAATLKDEGYIENFHEEVNGFRKTLTLMLRYVDGKSAIVNLQRVSKLSRRSYVGVDALPHVVNGYGIAIISTSKGVMSDNQARKHNVGGEVLCYVF